MGVDLDWRDQNAAHGVEIHRDLDLLGSIFSDALLGELFLSLLLVDPLEVDVGQVGLQLLSQSEALFIRLVLSTLHREACQDEALLVLLNLLFSEIDLEL